MFKLTILTFVLILVIGILLFWILLYITGSVEPRRLKKRRKANKDKSMSLYKIISGIYIIVLIAGLVWIFALLKCDTKM